MLEWGKIGAVCGFQVLENLAFLVRSEVLRGEKWEGRERALWRWSWKFWSANLVMEGLRLWRVRQMQFKEDFGAEKVESEVGVQSKELEERWWRDLFSSLGWVPATVLFGYRDSEEMSPGNEAWLGLGGMIPGVIGLKEAWKETA